MLRIYRAPNGRTYQYDEGKQPAGYELAEQPKAKVRRTANKAHTTTRKKVEDAD